MNNTWIPLEMRDEDANVWECPDCHEAVWFTEDGPAENRYNYCPCCGKRRVFAAPDGA